MLLLKKALRDLSENKGAYIACVSVIIIGLIIFSSFSIVINNLDSSQKSFYKNQNFAEGFAEIRSMPYHEVEKFNRIEGIEDIQGRFVKDAHVLFPERKQNTYLRLISVEPSEEHRINDMQLLQGAALDSDETNIWVDNKFFEANNLALNESLEIIANGTKKDLHVVGNGRTPEYIYALRTSSDLYPDPETFGIAFIPYEVMQKIFSQNNIVNNIVFTLEPGADFSKVEQEMEIKLDRYGLERIYPRSDQTSHMLITQEFNSLKAMANTLPVLFLLVAGTILFIMVRRMIEQQRGQIGVLKAFGYTEREILFHYITYPFVIGLAGGLIGGLFGIILSFPLTSLYEMFFNMPELQSGFSPVYFVLSILMALAFSICAGYQGCKSAMALQPAEAMQPPAPPVMKKTILEKTHTLWNMFTVQGKMAFRNIFRNKKRSFFVFIGVMFAFSLASMTWAMNDLTQVMLFDQYERVQTYNLKVDFAHPRYRNDVSRELGRFPGVKRAETMLEVPLTFKNKWHEKESVLLGVHSNSQLYKIVDKDYNSIQIPKDGILISERLADLLQAKVGTSLKVEGSIFKSSEDKELQVVGIVPQYIGLNAYMNIEAAANFFDRGDIATAAMLKMDEDKVDFFQEKYKDSSIINGITNRNEMYNQAKELMASFSGTIYLFALMAVITGFAIIYNSAMITLSERSRELASMMVLGMTPAEVLSVITFEQWFISAFAMLTGIPLTKLMLTGMAQAISNDMFTMPSDISAFSLMMAVFITVFSIFIAQRVAARKVKKLSLVEVLKSTE